MSLEGWIFMVGLRVFDVGGLILWLVWFFKLRDDDGDDRDDDGPGGGEPPEPEGPQPVPGGGLPLPLPDGRPWPYRRRDHGGDRRPATRPRRTRGPVPVPAHRRPERVRRSRARLDGVAATPRPRRPPASRRR